MHFPDWVDDPRVSDTERARRRLKYMIHNASAKVCPKPSIRAFAAYCEVDHSLLFYWINRGAISERMAQTLNACAGDDEAGNNRLPVAFLTHPLDI